MRMKSKNLPMIVLPLFSIRFELYILAQAFFMLLQLRLLNSLNIKPTLRTYRQTDKKRGRQTENK